MKMTVKQMLARPKDGQKVETLREVHTPDGLSIPAGTIGVAVENSRIDTCRIRFEGIGVVVVPNVLKDVKPLPWTA